MTDAYENAICEEGTREELIEHFLKARAENRRLREALGKIANRPAWQGRKNYPYTDEGIGEYWADMAKEFQADARAALAAEPASGEAYLPQRDLPMPTYEFQTPNQSSGGIAPPPPPTQGEVISIPQLEKLRECLSEFGSNGLDASTCLGLVETIAALRQRADEATRAENEACAGIAIKHLTHTSVGGGCAREIAAAIRARITPKV